METKSAHIKCTCNCDNCENEKKKEEKRRTQIAKHGIGYMSFHPVLITIAQLTATSSMLSIPLAGVFVLFIRNVLLNPRWLS